MIFEILFLLPLLSQVKSDCDIKECINGGYFNSDLCQCECNSKYYIITFIYF